MMLRVLAGTALMLIASTAAAQNAPASWLDRPLTAWNKPGDKLPAPPRGQGTIESREAVVSRCRLKPPASTAGERAVQAAGWIPFWNFDQQLVRDYVEIVGGMRDADGMCRPATYNLFVFVGGQFAGLLSPTHMTSRMDSSSGAVRFLLPSVTAEFSRYTNNDPLCCPSSRVRVTYRIDRPPEGPVVVATEVTARP
jgi:hypothetical protein